MSLGSGVRLKILKAVLKTNLEFELLYFASFNVFVKTSQSWKIPKHSGKDDKILKR